MLIEVHREFTSPCCLGTMTVDGAHFGHTLERPWLDNAPKVSAIPAGEYLVDITFSNRFKKPMIEIMNVPSRYGIRIHNANWWSQVEGCIAVAKDRHPDYHISGGLADVLKAMIQEAKGRGELVKIKIHDPKVAA